MLDESGDEVAVVTRLLTPLTGSGYSIMRLASPLGVSRATLYQPHRSSR